MRLAFLAAALLAAPLPAAAAPTLRAAVTVTSDLVLIGDLVADAGPRAGTPVFRAPEPGLTGRVPVAAVLAALRAGGLTDVDAGGLAGIEVTRAGRALAPADILPVLRAALAPLRNVPEPDSLDISFEPALRHLHLPAEASGEIRIAEPQWSASSGQFAAMLEVRRRDGGLERRPLAGSAIETATVIVPTRDLARGSIIGPNDVTPVRRPRSELQADTTMEEAAAIGRELRRAMRPGQPLRASDLAEPQLVRRGSMVVMIHAVGNLMLTARGKALRDGVRGETVPVTNLQSKRTLQALVTGPGEVSVAAPRLAVASR